MAVRCALGRHASWVRLCAVVVASLLLGAACNEPTPGETTGASSGAPSPTSADDGPWFHSNPPRVLSVTCAADGSTRIREPAVVAIGATGVRVRVRNASDESMRVSILEGPIPANASALRLVDLVPGRHRVRCVTAAAGDAASAFRVVDSLDVGTPVDQ